MYKLQPAPRSGVEEQRRERETLELDSALIWLLLHPITGEIPSRKPNPRRAAAVQQDNLWVYGFLMISALSLACSTLREFLLSFACPFSFSELGQCQAELTSSLYGKQASFTICRTSDFSKAIFRLSRRRTPAKGAFNDRQINPFVSARQRGNIKLKAFTSHSVHVNSSSRRHCLSPRVPLNGCSRCTHAT
jgi:hypothetical protein